MDTIFFFKLKNVTSTSPDMAKRSYYNTLNKADFVLLSQFLHKMYVTNIVNKLFGSSFGSSIVYTESKKSVA